MGYRSTAGTALCLLSIGFSGTAIPTQDSTLTLEDRVRAQESIDRVYYSHLVGSTLPFEEAIPKHELEAKVRNYLKESQALEQYWNAPVTGSMLEAELARISRDTQAPDRLQELFSALGGDTVLIQECLVRPALVARLTREFFETDRRIHAEPFQEAEAIHAALISGNLSVDDDHARRSVTDFRREDGSPHRAAQTEDVSHTDRSAFAREVELSSERFSDLRASLPGEIGEFTWVTEEPGGYVVRAVRDEKEAHLAIVSWIVPKLSWDQWWSDIEDSLDDATVPTIASPSVRVPDPVNSDASATCVPDDTWPTSGRFDDILEPRVGHTALWTGSHMIIWGGAHGLAIASGDRYDPATDTWSPVSNVGAPSARGVHTAIWTGSQMIVWGGSIRVPGSQELFEVLGTGGRYNPVSDTWLPTAPAPVEPRSAHTAVWTGQEMIIYGGIRQTEERTGTGARYDPSSDTWAPLPMVNNPGARALHTAVWTGSEMIVWGGATKTEYLGNGGRYNPSTDQWTPVTLTGAPSERGFHIAVWTGQVMIVWGGFNFTSYGTIGGRYNPATDSWQPMTVVNVPDAFIDHAAVWTGSRMLISDRDSAYDPVLNRWSATSAINRPPYADDETAVWTGTEMIVWGGSRNGSFRYTNRGGRYNPTTNTWTSTATPSFGPTPRAGHTAIWTGTQMIVWGGTDFVAGHRDGARYDPALDAWLPISSVGSPEGGSGYAGFWTGHYMLVWHGGGKGGRYDPSLDRWLPLSTAGTPFSRSGHSAVWTGTKMIVWGGVNGPSLSTGGGYDPEANTWSPTTTVDAPFPRWGHAAVWTGSEMLVWGGRTGGVFLDDGGRYDPVSDTWRPIAAATHAPSKRVFPSAVWTGSEMLVWGGDSPLDWPDPDFYLNTGARYSPSLDAWQTMSTADAPERRVGNTTIWTGREMIVWGGEGVFVPLATGGRYDPQTDTWFSTETLDAPRFREAHTAVWTGSYMAIWGGTVDIDAPIEGGGLYSLGMSSDDDGDGLSECEGDCNDDLEMVYPGAPQTCDGLNTDCDSPLWPLLPPDEKDDDRDGFRPCSGDCNDSNASILPAALESCNSVDDDCDGLVDEDPNGLDADLDIVGDPCDNCPFTANPAQEDTVHPNSVGDACEDPDADGVFDAVDICPDAPDAFQIDTDLDGVGDACDVCPAASNPGQEEAVACIDLGVGSGVCIDSSISMRPDNAKGTVRVLADRTIVPERIDFQILAASCGVADEMEFLLNGTLLGMITGTPVCSCGSPIQSFSITDAGLLRSLWRPEGGNTFQVRKTATPGDTGTFLSWVRVVLDTKLPPECLHDHEGGDCSGGDICTEGFSKDAFATEKTLDAPLIIKSEFATVPFEDSELPGSIDIASVPDGPATLCVETHGDTVLYGATDVGHFFTIDPSTAATTPLGMIPTGFIVGDVEFDDTTGRLYALADGLLQETDPKTGVSIGPFVVPRHQVGGLEFVDGRLYAAAFVNLATVSLETGDVAFVGPMSTASLWGLTYAPGEKALYATSTDSTSSTLHRVDPRTGAGALVGATGVPIAGLDFGPDGMLYGGGANSRAGLLYRIDPQSGQSTLVGDTGFRRRLYLTFASPLLRDCASFNKQGEEVLLINDTCNSPPAALAGSSISAECTSSSGTSVTLDGSASTDVDSSTGTNDDIVLFEWFRGAGTSSEELLGTGETLEVVLPLGSHEFALRVTDRAGVIAWDTVRITITDLTPPTILASFRPEVGKPDPSGQSQGRSRNHAGDVPGDDGDDADDGHEDRPRYLMARFGAMDACDPAPVIMGELLLDTCGSVPFADGQIVRFKQRQSTCDAEFKNGILEIKAPSIRLHVRAFDALGNTSFVDLDPPIALQDGEGFNRARPLIAPGPEGPATGSRTP